VNIWNNATADCYVSPRTFEITYDDQGRPARPHIFVKIREIRKISSQRQGYLANEEASEDAAIVKSRAIAIPSHSVIENFNGGHFPEELI
jgi:hypothetical protein